MNQNFQGESLFTRGGENVHFNGFFTGTSNLRWS